MYITFLRVRQNNIIAGHLQQHPNEQYFHSHFIPSSLFPPKSPNHFFLSYANQTKSFVRFSWQHCCCNMWAEKYLQAMKNTNPFWTQGTKINELLFWAHKEHGATCKGAGNHLVLLTAHRRTDNYVYCGQKCNTLKLYAKLLGTTGWLGVFENLRWYL